MREREREILVIREKRERLYIAEELHQLGFQFESEVEFFGSANGYI
jgi:hypothetical protein